MKNWRIVVVLFAVGTFVVLRFILGSGIDLDVLDNRFNLVQVVLELLGLIALVLAILSFAESQQKPNLKIVAKYKNSENPANNVFLPGTDGVLEFFSFGHDPSIKRHVLTAHLKLFLANLGPVPARFVKISLRPFASNGKIIGRVMHTYDGLPLEGRDRFGPESEAILRGKNEFVVHTTNENDESELEPLIDLEVQVRTKDPGRADCRLFVKAQCLGSMIQETEFTLKLPD